MNERRETQVQVLLVASGAEGRETLQATAATLEEFGLSWEEVTAAGAEFAAAQKARGVRAVVVASVDGQGPAWWGRATALPTLRVPAAEGGRAGLTLLWDEDGELPVADGKEEGEAFATMAIGVAGAKNAALFVVAMLAVENAALREKWVGFRERQTAAVLAGEQPGKA